ncbi:MAG TPA: hypothetical protein VGF99_01240 [Myxococcota bacterium]
MTSTAADVAPTTTSPPADTSSSSLSSPSSPSGPPPSPTSVLVELLEVVTVGFPFCAFKLLSGSLLINGSSSAGHVGGIVLTVLGITDIIVNVVNALALVLAKRRVLEACTLALFSRGVRRRSRAAWTWAELGSGVDVLLSMSIVAAMIGFGGIPRLSPTLLTVWNAAVISNVLGAGVARFNHSLEIHRRTRRS